MLRGLLVITVFICFFGGMMMLGEVMFGRTRVPPIDGSNIRSIEVYHNTPAYLHGKRNGIPDETFVYLAGSKALPINSFDKQSYDTDFPQNFSFVEKDKREGVEVVEIFSNDPKINISKYCH